MNWKKIIRYEDIPTAEVGLLTPTGAVLPARRCGGTEGECGLLEATTPFGHTFYVGFGVQVRVTHYAELELPR